jgi:putative toxin-antitoxin system antitoxin component (TIGR02293 family)
MSTAYTSAFMRADAILKIGAKDSRGAIEATRRGLAVAKVDELVKSGRATFAEIDRVVLPRKTLSHRRKIGVLTPEQSDRLIRLVRVIAAAEETFGSQEKAARWLRRPTTALEGDAPISLLDTGEGSRQVEHLLAMIDHGLAA